MSIVRELNVEKVEAECDATMTTIICLIFSLNSSIFLSLVCRKRWNSKICVIIAIERLSMNVSLKQWWKTFNRWQKWVERFLQRRLVIDNKKSKKSLLVILVQWKVFYKWRIVIRKWQKSEINNEERKKSVRNSRSEVIERCFVDFIDCVKTRRFRQMRNWWRNVKKVTKRRQNVECWKTTKQQKKLSSFLKNVDIVKQQKLIIDSKKKVDTKQMRKLMK